MIPILLVILGIVFLTLAGLIFGAALLIRRRIAPKVGYSITAKGAPKRNLRDIAGTWVEDPLFDSALEEQDTVDQELWR